MAGEIVTIRIFSNETEAAMAQQVIEESGIRAYVLKDDAGGMEPHLQRTTGVRVIVSRADAQRAHEILRDLEKSPG